MYTGNWFEATKTCACGADVKVNASQATYDRRNDRYAFEVPCNQCHQPYKGYFKMERVQVEDEVAVPI